MSHWNYRVIASEDSEFGEITYAIHEVYYDDEGEINGWTESPVSFAADSKLGLIDILAAASTAAAGKALWPVGGELREEGR